jgi:hypothetical protein
MSWLNELGAVAVSARTMDIDVARKRHLAFGTPVSFLATLKTTGLPFSAVAGFTPSEPATSVKLPGIEGLRVDLLVPGKEIGAAVHVPARMGGAGYAVLRAMAAARSDPSRIHLRGLPYPSKRPRSLGQV